MSHQQLERAQAKRRNAVELVIATVDLVLGLPTTIFMLRLGEEEH